MQILYSCPTCAKVNRQEASESSERLACDGCGWMRPVTAAGVHQGQPRHCLVCGCDDLWRQKDFPQKIGVLMVALGAILSTIAITFYYPATALGILLAFALVDLLLYVFMPDVLVCYRCQARHRYTNPGEEFPRFNLETAERYRQEAARLAEKQSPAKPAPQPGQ